MRRKQTEPTVDQHRLLLDEAIRTLPVVMLGDVESVLALVQVISWRLLGQRSRPVEKLTVRV
jgi:hypothetical protein